MAAIRIGIATLLIGCVATRAAAQADLQQSLQRLDRNENGMIEPNEITPLARPYLENIAKPSKLSLSATHSIDRYQKAARYYFALKNGVNGERLKPDTVPKNGVVEFGVPDGEPYTPGFGLPVKGTYAVTDDDRRQASSIIRRYDRDKNGFVTREEAQRASWTYRDPFESDFNRDDRLSELELQQRFARRRILAGNTSAFTKKSTRDKALGRPSWTDPKEKGTQKKKASRPLDTRSRGPTSPGYLTDNLLSNFDANRNGRLEAQESKDLGLPVSQIDANRDAEISREELFRFVQKWQEETSDESLDALPDWFFDRDQNNDQQIAMSEFTDEWTSEKAEQFVSYDTNGDGIVTIDEIRNSKALSGGVYRANSGEVLPPRKTIVSEIEVTDDFIVGDLNVELSLTHSHCAHLEGFLIGPDGQQIELFTNVGGGDDNFDRTIFDDQAGPPIIKAKPPFRGSFHPEALTRKQTSLSHFNGKTIQGVWQLMIRGPQNDRFGMLHHWELHVKPQGEFAAENVVDGPQETAGNEDANKQKADKPRRAAAFWGKGEGRTEDEIREAHKTRLEQVKQWRDTMQQKLKSGEMGEKESDQLRSKLEKFDDFVKGMKERRDEEIRALKDGNGKDKDRTREEKQLAKEIRKADKKSRK